MWMISRVETPCFAIKCATDRRENTFNKVERKSKRYKINISFNEKIPQCRENTMCPTWFSSWSMHLGTVAAGDCGRSFGCETHSAF